MDRTIKFRAWSTMQKKMYPVDEFTCNWNRNFDTKSSELVIKKDNILMQFTGLHDNEGKEVWEGDVLEIWIENIKQDNLYTVEKIEELYFEINKDDPYYRFTQVKVIGNIYEHPNLLQ